MKNLPTVGSEVLANLCFDNDEGDPIDDYNMDYFIIGRNDKVVESEVSGQVYITHNQREYLLYKNFGKPLDILNNKQHEPN